MENDTLPGEGPGTPESPIIQSVEDLMNIAFGTDTEEDLARIKAKKEAERKARDEKRAAEQNAAASADASDDDEDDPLGAAKEVIGDLNAKVATPGNPLAFTDKVKRSLFLDKSRKGELLGTKENLLVLMEQYGITARYNEVKKEDELILPGTEYSQDNRRNNAMTDLISISARNRLPLSNIPQYVSVLADNHQYNPVKEWIDSKPWDGVSRLQDMYATVTVPDNFIETRNNLMFRWFVSCIAAQYKPGFNAEGVLIFTGGQGLGKTKWLKRLAPRELGAVLDGAVLVPDNKDSVATCIRHWLVEIGEFDATLRKNDIARLKSFITSEKDQFRRPYAAQDSEYQRRTVFFASVNDHNFLDDPTGTRRWWTLPVTDVCYTHKIDMQQFWAEMKELTVPDNSVGPVKPGERWHLTYEEQQALGKGNEEFMIVDPVEELITSTYDWESDNYGAPPMTATDVLRDLDLPINRSTRLKAAGVLKKLAKPVPRVGSGAYYKMPARKNPLNPMNHI